MFLTENPKFDGSDMRSIMAAIASISAVGLGLGLSGPLLSLLMERAGLSAGLIGANTAIGGFAAILAVPFVTPLAKRFGVVTLMVSAILIAAVCLVLFFFTNPYPAWFILRFIFSLCLCAVFVLSEFWINHAADERNRGIILGLYGTILSLGFAFGPAIITLVGIEGFLPFGIGLSIFLLSALPAVLARNGQPVMEKTEQTPKLLSFIFIVPLATMAGFVFGAAEQSQLALLPIYGTASGMTAADAALLLTVLGIGNVVFQMPLGMWSDRVRDRRSILFVCALTGLAGAALLPLASESIWLTYLVIFLWGGVIGGLYTVGLAHLGSRLTGTNLAQANAAFVLCYAIGMTVGPQMTGISMDVFGPTGFSIGLGSMFIAYLLLYGWRRLSQSG